MSLLAKLPLPSALTSRLDAVLSVLPSAIPRPLKWAFWALLILNWDGFPGVWHLRIIWPFIRFQWQVKLGKKWPNWRIGKDEFEFRSTRQFRASFNSSDSFGYHLSNSEYSVCLDHVRGPFAVQLVGEAYGIVGMTFAIGGVSLDFRKEIPLLTKFEIENRLVGHDRKWLYIETVFRSLPHPKTGARTTYAIALSRFVIKHNRRTIPPYRAFALTGYGAEHGAKNYEVVQTMSQKEKLAWLVGDDVGVKGKSIVCGPVERGMEGRSEWAGQVQIA
ncbi:hypothetical protein Rhopal_003199-T1 [Rhodotorula paludigena]|uniref:Uncharacterized protein n=1 Tax=Rhodotorula paludigena TaxID=86838 RepID=A0AAV5GCC5_9BASI|nr:hypothetical protein Rhopal_003199-T1 [Rhodotorula paludigena]